jgi:hypothetical protein
MYYTLDLFTLPIALRYLPIVVYANLDGRCYPAHFRRSGLEPGN